MSVRTALGATVTLTAALVSLPAYAQSVDLDALREATAVFADVDAALAAGYIEDPSGACISAAMEGLPPEMGAMGIHYLNPALLGLKAPGERVDGTGINTDWAQPSILVYEPQADGSLELVAVENLVWQAAWAAAGNTAPPSINGKVWDTMADDMASDADEAHGFAPHFDQHVWLQRENPAGVYASFNPAVNCGT